MPWAARQVGRLPSARRAGPGLRGVGPARPVAELSRRRGAGWRGAGRGALPEGRPGLKMCFWQLSALPARKGAHVEFEPAWEPGPLSCNLLPAFTSGVRKARRQNRASGSVALRLTSAGRPGSVPARLSLSARRLSEFRGTPGRPGGAAAGPEPGVSPLLLLRPAERVASPPAPPNFAPNFECARRVPHDLPVLPARPSAARRDTLMTYVP